MQQLIIIIMEASKILLCSSNFPWARERILFEIYGQFGHAPSKSFAIPVPDHHDRLVHSNTDFAKL